MPDSKQHFQACFLSFHGLCCVSPSSEQQANSPLSLRSIKECEKLVKAAYQRNGLVYQESSSEEDGEEGCPLSPEVIEIDDEEDDDDVIAVGCCELYEFILVLWVKNKSMDGCLTDPG